jgi:hypothetical protein
MPCQHQPRSAYATSKLALLPPLMQAALMHCLHCLLGLPLGTQLLLAQPTAATGEPPIKHKQKGDLPWLDMAPFSKQDTPGVSLLAASCTCCLQTNSGCGDTAQLA